MSVFGGDPAFIMDTPLNDYAAGAFSHDNRSVAAFCRRSGDDKFGVFVSSPLGSPWRRYQPDPFATTVTYSGPGLEFAPDGSKILLWYTGEKVGAAEQEVWILPFPPGRGKPRRVLTNLPPHSVLTAGSWMPDSRHLVVGLFTGDHSHLWLADTESNDAYQITTGISSVFSPGVSPDGKTLVLRKFEGILNVISVSLVDGKVQTLVGTENARMAAWASKAQALAYVTDRNGPMEVWIRSGDGSTRPAVTQGTFPGSRNLGIMNPALSPDGTRIIFCWHGPNDEVRNWIMLLSEGVPQRLNASSNDVEFGGTWSPDGRRFAKPGIFEKSSIVCRKCGQHRAPRSAATRRLGISSGLVP
jgi:Tol biopolymer transport system component